MKRDMDLVREILLAVERSDADPIDSIQIVIPNYTLTQVSYHVHIMEEAGLVEALDLSSDDGYDFEPKRLTWHGHEYLDTIRDPAIWRETKKQMEAAGGFSLDLVKAIAKGFIKKKIEQHTGVSLDL